jgi:hypothetical protein
VSITSAAVPVGSRGVLRPRAVRLNRSNSRRRAFKVVTFQGLPKFLDLGRKVGGLCGTHPQLDQLPGRLNLHARNAAGQVPNQGVRARGHALLEPRDGRLDQADAEPPVFIAERWVPEPFLQGLPGHPHGTGRRLLGRFGQEGGQSLFPFAAEPFPVAVTVVRHETPEV